MEHRNTRNRKEQPEYPWIDTQLNKWFFEAEEEQGKEPKYDLIDALLDTCLFIMRTVPKILAWVLKVLTVIICLSLVKSCNTGSSGDSLISIVAALLDLLSLVL